MLQKKLGKTNFDVSQIGLGTAQLGSAYGLGPREILPESESIALLHQAVDMGVTFFDTAFSYDLSEERIGKSKIAYRKNVIISTKCGLSMKLFTNIEKSPIKNFIQYDIEISRKRLDMDILPLVMLHGGTSKQIKTGYLVDIMRNLKEEKKIKYAGICVQGPEAFLAAINTNFFDVIQVGYSILDQRIDIEMFRKAYSQGIGIVVRSVLLKGALTSAVKYLNNYHNITQNVLMAKEIAKNMEITLSELAIRFALINPLISTILVGTNKISHLKSAVDCCELNQNFPFSVIEQLKLLAINDENSVDPSNWKL